MGFLAAQGAILVIGTIISVICTVTGLFFWHIILFDSTYHGQAAPIREGQSLMKSVKGSLF